MNSVSFQAQWRGRSLEADVRARRTAELLYQLKIQEEAGRAGGRLNSQEARRRADDLQARLEMRLSELEREAQESEAFAAVALRRDGSGTAAEVCIVDRVTGKTTTRRLMGPSG